MTSVFLVLRERPKLPQPWDKQCISCCIICSVLTLRCIVISKQEVSDDGLLHLCNSLQAPKVEQIAVSPVSDLYSALAVMEGIRQHGGGYCTEERRSENAAFFHAVYYWKGFWMVSVIRNFIHHAIVKLPGDRCDLAQTSQLSSPSRLCSPYQRP